MLPRLQGLLPRLLPRELPFFITCRAFSLAPQAAEALKSIKDAVPPKRKVVQLSKKEKKELQGNIGKYANNCGRPEFHNVDLDRHGRVFEPTDVSEVVITSSKNNVCEVRFRWLHKVEVVLQAFQAHGLHVTRITHVPRLPKGDPHKCRKRRRV